MNDRPDNLKMSLALRALGAAGFLLGPWLPTADPPPELPLWEKPAAALPRRGNIQDQVRSFKPAPNSPSARPNLIQAAQSEGMRPMEVRITDAHTFCLKMQ